MTDHQEEVKSRLKTSVPMKVPSMVEASLSPAEGFAQAMPQNFAASDVSMNQEDDERRQKKKELNRLAAQRSREKRRNLIKHLEEQVNGLETTNSSLKSEISSMRRELSQLDYMLQSHQCLFTQQE